MDAETGTAFFPDETDVTDTVDADVGEDLASTLAFAVADADAAEVLVAAAGYGSM